ncbi:MAG: hypothetical protein CMJ83_21870, partial [Planctomycetes bacterium]|nr:hypothetical protein [Planctomycetota bacterium]
ADVISWGAALFDRRATGGGLPHFSTGVHRGRLVVRFSSRSCPERDVVEREAGAVGSEGADQVEGRWTRKAIGHRRALRLVDAPGTTAVRSILMPS